MYFALLAVLLAGVASAQEPRVFRAPFHSINGLILLDVKLGGKPAVLLLDTGAQTTAINRKDAKAFTTVIQGARTHASLTLSPDLVYSGDFYVADFSEISKQAGTQIDGLLGHNILRDFSAVRIDYKASVIEFEKQNGTRRLTIQTVGQSKSAPTEQ